MDDDRCGKFKHPPRITKASRVFDKDDFGHWRQVVHLAANWANP
jgi:hypothetical protein